MILTDNETKIDLLNSESIAVTIVELLRERPSHPVTIGVHGDWGAGKSSVLEMIEHTLEKHPNVLCIKFNGWRFQGFEDAKIALIEGIVTELVDKRSLLTKATEEVKDVFKRIDWLKLAKKTSSYIITASTGIPAPEVVQDFIGGLRNIASNPSQLATAENLHTIINQANSILKPKESKKVPKEISEFRKAFENLLKLAGVEQLVVLVDDLDRCLPDTAIETLEAIRLFIFTNKTAFVVAADEAMIEYAVRKHFPDLAESGIQQQYTRNYLEKLIQVPFRIPILGEMETRIYVTLLLVGSEIGDESTEFNFLIGIAREKLKKPWESKPLDSETIRKALGPKASKVQNSLLISEQIGPILARGTKGNPRQIKRFLNTLILRHRTAKARGFEQAVHLPVLAKLMVAERFLPRFFEQIAESSATASDGKNSDLALFERMLKNEKEQDTKPSSSSKKKSAESVQENLLIQEWLSSRETREWAELNPSLAEIDLRPYIFVAKDKKDYFGSSTSLGHLTVIVEKLFAKRIVIQTASEDVKKLSPIEASQIFEAIRSRLINNSSFQSEPDGIAGLALLVKSHPLLQQKLVDFLEALPVDKLGAWVVKGWDGILSGDSKQRFDNLLETWETTGNQVLKTVIMTSRKMRK